MARIQWNIGGFRKVRRLPALERELLNHAKDGAEAAGDGYIAVSEIGPNRARAAVVAASGHARHDNAQEHTLLRVIDNMRD
jgi:hypothetical protein